MTPLTRSQLQDLDRQAVTVSRFAAALADQLPDRAAEIYQAADTLNAAAQELADAAD